MSRMSDSHFILSIMTTLEIGGYFTRDVEIEKMISLNNDEYSKKEEISKTIIEVLQNIKALNLEADSIWYRKSNFFTLVIELAKARNLDYPKIKRKLLELEKNVLENKYKPRDENEFSTYYAYMYTGTNSRQARVIRSEIFTNNIL